MRNNEQILAYGFASLIVGFVVYYTWFYILLFLAAVGAYHLIDVYTRNNRR